MSVEMIPTLINEQWTILLPEHRAARPEWPFWERARMESIHDAVQSKMGISPGYERPVMWDIGCEEGDMMGLFSMWGCDVVGSEPNPRVWPNIRAIWEANDLRPMLGQFVGFIGGVTETPLSPLAGTGWNIVRGDWPVCAYGPLIGDHGFSNLWERPDIPSITLDAATSYIPACNGITIDVEGAEMRVLAGAAETIQRHKPIVWVSIHVPEFLAPYGDKPEDVLSFFSKVGYDAELVDAAAHEQHWMFAPR